MHFTVLVRVSSRTQEHRLEAQVKKILTPYNEDENAPGVKRVWTDTQAEDEKKYETGSVEKVQTPEGGWVYPWDDTFKTPQYRKNPADSFSRGDPPKDWPLRTFKFTELWGSFREFMHSWCSMQVDPVKKRFGHWGNPDAHWDDYQIGGRWARFLDGANFARIYDLDLVKANEVQSESALTFWREWHEYVECLLDPAKMAAHEKKVSESWQSPTRSEPGPALSTARLLGYLKSYHHDEEPFKPTGKEWHVFERSRPKQGDQDYRWIEVLPKKPDRTEFFARGVCFFDPLLTFARLCKADGWVERGWREEGSQGLDYCTGFREWLARGNQRDWVALVDCHT